MGEVCEGGFAGELAIFFLVVSVGLLSGTGPGGCKTGAGGTGTMKESVGRWWGGSLGLGSKRGGWALIKSVPTRLRDLS